jgi:hypothetical protein
MYIKLLLATIGVTLVFWSGILTSGDDHYQQFFLAQVVHADADDDYEREERSNEESPYEEIFAWVGKLAVIMGALSMSWYFVKRKRVSKIDSVRKFANFLYSLHKVTGFGALFLIIAHGTYFFWNEWPELETITGLLAFVMLITLVIYGIRLNRQLLPRTRRIHYILALIWIVVTIIHATDAIPLLVVVIGLSYGYIWLIERKQAKI